MTVRSDINVDLQPSPRVAEVAAPSVSVTMQDLLDTLRVEEQSFANGLAHTKLVNASGKEPLGGGVFVGVTLSLQDTLLSFEGRTTPAETGTVTTGSSTPIQDTITFEDTAADFVTADVARGSLVINFTDHSIAEVVSVDSATALTTKTLVNGIGNTFDTADVYHVFNITQCDAVGGNLTSVDSDDNDISPILPTAFTQVVRTSSASATLAEQADIQYASYSGGVTVDLTGIYSGTTYPVGTHRQPVNNFTDALTIANARGFDTFYIIGDATIDNGLTYTGKIFIGESAGKSEFTIDADAGVQNCEFNFATVQGTLDGGNVLHDCTLKTINYVDGRIERCLLTEVVTLSSQGTAWFLDCWSGVPGADTPEINCGGSGTELAVRNYAGGLKLTNKSGNDACSIDMNSGQLIIDDTVTADTLILRGVGKWTNKATYAGGATIQNELIEYDIVGLRETVETGWTGMEAMRVMLAALAGKLQQTGDPIDTIVIRDVNDTKDRITATVDGGNRLVISIDKD